MPPKTPYGSSRQRSPFFGRDRSMLRLAGTRYLRVTVKLSVLLTQPRI